MTKNDNKIEGGKKAAQKLLAVDPDYYKKIGSAGGKKGKGGGFTGNPELAKLTGRLGGRKPLDGQYSLARRDRITKARLALKELNKQRGTV